MNRKRRRAEAKKSKAAAKTGGGAKTAVDTAGLIQQAFQASAGGDSATAKSLCRKVLKADRDNVDARHLLGILAYQEKDYEEAVKQISRAVDVEPEFAEAHSNLGSALKDSGQFAEAEEHLRRAIALKPEFSKAYNNLGTLLAAVEQFKGAEEAFRKAISLDPGFVLAHNHLGQALLDQELFEEARASFAQAVKYNPSYAEAYNNLGLAYQRDNKLKEGEEALRRAVALNPNYALAHTNLGINQLLAGQWQEGWQEYEWRRQLPDKFPMRAFDAPLWNGEDINGKTILVHAEQGLGDTIQFCRYVCLIKRTKQAQNARVIFSPHGAVERVLKDLPGVDEVSVKEPHPAFDVHVPLMSLPRIFKVRPQNTLWSGPYLKAEDGLINAWKSRLEKNTGNDGDANPVLKVGIIWAGNPDYHNDRNRSIPLEWFEPVFAAPGVRLFSLQMGKPREEMRKIKDESVTDRSEYLTDFAETAAAMNALDLIISVDTAGAHLAGALGRPVWTLLPFAPDWRWMLERTDTPWYPTMRLFRQQDHKEWPAVLVRVAEALVAHAKAAPRV